MSESVSQPEDGGKNRALILEGRFDKRPLPPCCALAAMQPPDIDSHGHCGRLRLQMESFVILELEVGKSWSRPFHLLILAPGWN